MAYTSRQYEAQRRIQAAIGLANAAGLCVVCMRRPQATWPDGVRRIACGQSDCYDRWLTCAQTPNSPKRIPMTSRVISGKGKNNL